LKARCLPGRDVFSPSCPPAVFRIHVFSKLHNKRSMR
jgi:hypothetical protein